nr:hypothetical protein [Tanacetum cinerariifolium]
MVWSWCGDVGKVAAAMLMVRVVFGGGSGVDGDGAWGEWHGGSDRSKDGESSWVRRKKPAGKVFRRRRRGGWPA